MVFLARCGFCGRLSCAMLEPVEMDVRGSYSLRADSLCRWLRRGTLSVFSCQVPAFSVRWMLTAYKGKKEGSAVLVGLT